MGPGPRRYGHCASASSPTGAPYMCGLVLVGAAQCFLAFGGLAAFTCPPCPVVPPRVGSAASRSIRRTWRPWWPDSGNHTGPAGLMRYGSIAAVVSHFLSPSSIADYML